MCRWVAAFYAVLGCRVGRPGSNDRLFLSEPERGDEGDEGKSKGMECGVDWDKGTLELIRLNPSVSPIGHHSVPTNAVLDTSSKNEK